MRKVYRDLEDNDENFPGWTIGEGVIYLLLIFITLSVVSLIDRKTIKTKENVEVISKLIKEVRALNPTFSGSDIRGL